jgi:hypothetical protein
MIVVLMLRIIVSLNDDDGNNNRVCRAIYEPFVVNKFTILYSCAAIGFIA